MLYGKSNALGCGMLGLTVLNKEHEGEITYFYEF
jgi:hypothetical protein